jgi:hypothetical protein
MQPNAMIRLRIVVVCTSLFVLGSTPVDPGSTCVFGCVSIPDQPCAPFTTVSARLLDSFPEDAIGGKGFGRSGLGAIVTLSDKSLVLQFLNNLYRISGKDITTTWAGGRPGWQRPQAYYWIGARPHPTPTLTPRSYDRYVHLLGSFDNTAVVQYGPDWIYGIGPDGTVTLPFYLAGSDMNGRPTFSGRDTYGTLWFESFSKRNKRDTVYALYPNGTLHPLTTPVGQAFQGSTGFVYGTSDSGLLELRSIPYVHTRVFTTWDKARFGNTSFLFRHRVGADGSLWSSTSTSIIHKHTDGRIDEMRFRGGSSTISHWPIPLQMESSPDGSVWIAYSTRLVRISTDDRIELMDVPDMGYYPELRTLWTAASGYGPPGARRPRFFISHHRRNETMFWGRGTLYDAHSVTVKQRFRTNASGADRQTAGHIEIFFDYAQGFAAGGIFPNADLCRLWLGADDSRPINPVLHDVRTRQHGGTDDGRSISADGETID